MRIYRQSGYFVNMLKGVVKESVVFFMLFILILFAFTSSFFTLHTPEDPENFLDVLFYSYLLSLGEFDMEWDE